MRTLKEIRDDLKGVEKAIRRNEHLRKDVPEWLKERRAYLLAELEVIRGE